MMTRQERLILRRNRAAKRTREVFPSGTRVRARAGGMEGTVVRHVPMTNAQGGHLVVAWDNGHTGSGVGPISVEVVQ